MKFARKVRYIRAIVVSGVLAASVPGLVEAAETKQQLIERGRQLFTKETFDGNGRTCATCHPASNNFTIDPAFIAKLPKSDPLFVAETNPDLAKLEDSKALRQRALIRENVDGFDRPAVLRGVPHTLALPVSMAPDDDADWIRSSLTGASPWMPWAGRPTARPRTARWASLRSGPSGSISPRPWIAWRGWISACRPRPTRRARSLPTLAWPPGGGRSCGVDVSR